MIVFDDFFSFRVSILVNTCPCLCTVRPHFWAPPSRWLYRRAKTLRCPTRSTKPNSSEPTVSCRRTTLPKNQRENLSGLLLIFSDFLSNALRVRFPPAQHFRSHPISMDYFVHVIIEYINNKYNMYVLCVWFITCRGVTE